MSQNVSLYTAIDEMRTWNKSPNDADAGIVKENGSTPS